MAALDSLWKANLALLEPTWEQIFDILGDTATVLPLIGAGDDGAPDATSFTTRRRTSSGLEAVFTWQATDGGPANWTNGNDYTSKDRWQGIVPIVDFDGVDDEADSPDAAYWSRGNGSTDSAFSVGAWVNMTDATSSTILSKIHAGGNTREWEFMFDGSDQLKLRFYDESVSGNPDIFTAASAATSQGVWAFVVATYNGDETPSGINLYEGGALVASNDTDDVNYVAMEDLGGTVKLGFINTTPGNLFDGKMAGGPFGPFFVQAELNAAQVKRLFTLGRAALGLT